MSVQALAGIKVLDLSRVLAAQGARKFWQTWGPKSLK